MTKEKRRKWPADRRAAILREHLVDKKAVSDICDAHGIQPSLFYSWLRQLYENMESALQDGRGKGNALLERKVDELEEKLARSESVIARKETVTRSIPRRVIAHRITP